ncbi:cupredoxin domain-containing protein [Candidatus Bathyarchaeota archaeon]|nr:cupredoxin domain-containing protein [Candidatus Bathyarchaeota archaeon]
MVTWNPRNVVVTALLLSAIVGAGAGFGVTYGLRSHSSPQARDFYLFAVDQGFNSSTAQGLKADYDFSANVITTNVGDTLVIHFYNPTDTAHTFTMNSPYSNDVYLPPMTNTTISNANITIHATQAGIFPFYCKFHGPSMSGSLVVQG